MGPSPESLVPTVSPRLRCLLLIAFFSDDQSSAAASSIQIVTSRLFDHLFESVGRLRPAGRFAPYFTEHNEAQTDMQKDSGTNLHRVRHPRCQSRDSLWCFVLTTTVDYLAFLIQPVFLTQILH